MRIKNLIFDMGGVLIDLDRDASVEAFRTIGYPDADELLDNYAPKGVFRQLEIGNFAPEDFYAHVQNHIGRDIPVEQIENALLKFLNGLPVYKLDMLRDLRKRFNIFMLSNTNAIMMPYIREKYFTQQGLTFEDYFDRAYLSFEMRAMKPDEEIFNRMIADGQIDPAYSFFIDDGPANIETARKLGFRTYLASPQEDFRHIFDVLQV